MKALGAVRMSQLVSVYGPGAIVDLPTLSVIIAGLNHWTTRPEDAIDEPRLKRSLGVADLFQPPVEEDSRGVLQGTVPYFVFPRFLICPRCRHLADASEFPWNSSLARYECQKGGCPGKGAISVIPSRFVVACPNGHLSDFPYRAYAHDDPGASCPGPLRLIDTGLTGSLADLQVSCTQVAEPNEGSATLFQSDWEPSWADAMDTGPGWDRLLARRRAIANRSRCCEARATPIFR